MASPEARLIATSLIRGVERAPDEVLDAEFACDFEDANSPIDFCFFADGEPVQINERDFDVGECGVEIGFVVPVARDDCYVGEGGELERGWGVCGAR